LTYRSAWPIFHITLAFGGLRYLSVSHGELVAKPILALVLL